MGLGYIVGRALKVAESTINAGISGSNAKFKAEVEKDIEELKARRQAEREAQEELDKMVAVPMSSAPVNTAPKTAGTTVDDELAQIKKNLNK